MKAFELTYLTVEPFMLPLHREVRRRLLELVKEFPGRPEILDVGGRKSHYTIHIPAHITVTDLPRESDTQRAFNLGLNQEIADKMYTRRSNIKRILFDDMTRSALPDTSFDYVVSVEVLEHVEEDERFVSEVERVLRPGGVFLMTTPNGDYVKTPTGDHKRHYTREQLRALLSSRFERVEVDYAILAGVYRSMGLKSWSLKRPQQTVMSMIGNFINAMQSSRVAVRSQANRTSHLIATAKKRG
jgi:SAM-dependent methyltransferase